MPEPSADPPRIPWRQLGGAAVVVAVLALAGVLAWSLSPQPKPAPVAETPSFPPPALTPSPFRNTSAEAHYTGSKTCTKCHAAETESFRDTGMGRSMAVARADEAPPDATIDHPPSGRRYQVYRKDGRLHHRELLRTSGKDEIELSDFPIQYVVGSGHHALTYLVEVDGFLVESPVSWYRSKNKWDMSPGYDKPDQLGFERPIVEACLLCHAGRVDPLDGSMHRFHVREETIGCERCHGPGSLHLDRQNRLGQTERPAAGATDDTIVNPKRLPRAVAEAVCEQCHLQSPCMLPVRGRRLDEFRPGLLLQDFRLDFDVHEPNTPMKVTGHVEQMHQSACYQKSADMTCMTCHNPHGFPKEEQRVGYYRAICQNCHEHRKPCTDPAAQHPEIGCVKCHMPTGKTDIPHLAFTHHRIGFHPDHRHPMPPLLDARDPNLLQPVHDLSRMSDLDRKRALGVAYLQLFSVQRDPGMRNLFRNRGILFLNQVDAAGMRDAVVDSNLCRLSYGEVPERVVFAAQRALAHPDLVESDRCDAMYFLAEAYFRQAKYEDAIAVLNDLNRLRRHPPYWKLLADCYQKLGNHSEEVRALEKAVTINPTETEARRRLAAYYEQKGDSVRAEYHRQRAERLD